ncbi:MAG: CsbD family protein [Micrococcales bacterium]|nr:CsbD family protein [Micrococcales bacterium]
MAIKQDDIKGRAKIAAGAVTGNKELENEGRMDRMAGDAKKQLDKIAGKAKDLLGTGTSQASGWVDQAKSAAEGLIDKIKK